MFSGGLLFICGLAIGLSITALSAQQREGRARGPRLPTMEEVPQELPRSAS